MRNSSDVGGGGGSSEKGEESYGIICTIPSNKRRTWITERKSAKLKNSHLGGKPIKKEICTRRLKVSGKEKGEEGDAEGKA